MTLTYSFIIYVSSVNILYGLVYIILGICTINAYINAVWFNSDVGDKNYYLICHTFFNIHWNRNTSGSKTI